MYKRAAHINSSLNRMGNVTVGDYTLGYRSTPLPRVGSFKHTAYIASYIGLMRWCRRNGVMVRTLFKSIRGVPESGLYKAVELKSGNVGFGRTTEGAVVALQSGMKHGRETQKILIRMMIEKAPPDDDQGL